MEEMRLRKTMSDVTIQVKAMYKIEEEISGSSSSKKGSMIVQVKCECCGLEEECSHDYLNKIKEIFFGKWVCGLCSEAIKEKLIKLSKLSSSSCDERSICMRDALTMHKEFCDEFNASMRTNPKLSLTWALRDVARRSSVYRRSSSEIQTPATSNRLGRSASCVPRIDLDFGGKE